MNYTQTLEFLFSSLPAYERTGTSGYKPGLERITSFCRHLGNPSATSSPYTWRAPTAKAPCRT